MTHVTNFIVDKTKLYRIKTILEGRPGTDDKLDYVIGHMHSEAIQDGRIYEVTIVSNLTGETYYISPLDIEAVE